MAILDIITYPDPRLKIKADAVVSFDRELHSFLENMKETMYDAEGIGLAATQVATMKQIAVIDVSEERNQPIELINPQIIESVGKSTSKEGCLSIPDFRETISRKTKVKVKAQNRFGEFFEFEASDLFAFCVQHELDHLNGILFVDHLSVLKKKLFLKWSSKHLPESIDI